MIAFHQALIVGRKEIANYAGVKSALTNLNNRIPTGRGSTAVSERKKNVDAVKGLLEDHLADSDLHQVYGNHSVTDIDAIIRRSQIELPEYELKQGLLKLSADRGLDPNVLDKVLKTICAIANNGKDRRGSILIGVSDNDGDAAKIARLDGVVPRVVGGRSVVGVKREADHLGESVETYFDRWKHAISNSDMSASLKADVLSSLSFHSYFGLGLITISVPPQSSASFLDSQIYARHGDSTVLCDKAPDIAVVVQRFA